jgi:YesN/AraC family two-component response regulator
MTIRILLADDQFLILEGIKAILEPEPAINVVGTAYDGKTAIALVKKLRPDILLIDIEMPQMNGILATKHIRKYFPITKVIVLTSHKNQDYIAEALLAGASDYLWKGNLIEDLKQEIYAFGQGYSGVKAKLLTKGQSHMGRGISWDALEGTSGDQLTQTAQKKSPTNTVKYREKMIYLKQYRQNIYKLAVKQKQQRLRKTSNLRLVNRGIAKVGLEPRFEPLTTKEIRATNPKTFSLSSVYSRPRFKRRKYLKRIIWLLLAISSIVLSIVIF